jgi:hypothetical protein
MNGLLSVFSKINVPSILRHIGVLLAQFSRFCQIPYKKIWGQIWSCVIAPRQNPPHVDTGNLSRFPFGSCKLDSIGKGLEMVQFAEGDVVDRWPVDGERRWLK